MNASFMALGLMLSELGLSGQQACLNLALEPLELIAGLLEGESQCYMLLDDPLFN